MTEKENCSNHGGDLRHRAEKKIRIDLPKTINNLSLEEVQKVYHELLVHQIELEMQNDELSRVQRELEASRARYFDLYDQAPVGYITVNEPGLILEANLTTTELLGVVRSTLVKQPLSRYILPEDQDIYYMYHKKLYETGAPQVCELRLIKKSGDSIWVRLETNVMLNTEGVPQSRIVISDISERKCYEEQLKYLSFHDSLTGLYNRAYFENELCRLNMGREYPITIISTDLNGLKLINDTVGHYCGDILLKNFALTFKESLRGSDILARVGGDEYVAILPRTDDKTGEGIATRIRSKIIQYNQEHPQLPMSISVGVVTVKCEGKLLEALKEADNLMYQDKLLNESSTKSQIVKAFIVTLREKDNITEGHILRLEELCQKIGKKTNLSSQTISNLILLSRVYDLGKVGISESILLKKGPLTAEEWKIMHLHPMKGYNIAMNMVNLVEVADLILKHHEWWNGCGYPKGMKDEEIPIECRILAIIDAYDAMTNDRPYRKAMSKEESIQELKRYAGIQFDPKLVRVFLSVLEKGE